MLYDNTGLSDEQIARSLENYREKIMNQIKRLPNGQARDMKEDKLRRIDAKCNYLWNKVRNSHSRS